LSIAAVIQFNPGTRIVDIGCGGGFPGVPLAIFFPEVEFHLVDSIAKKLKVVAAVCEGADIKNITVQHTRAEDIKGRKFDFAVSRAVAPLKDLLRWSYPLVEKGKKQELANGLICLKGGDLTQEIFESGARPGIVPISTLFKEDYFQEKFVLHVAR
jgi:16S rRNA (guanine527-N7)-methyltransferase